MVVGGWVYCCWVWRFGAAYLYHAAPTNTAKDDDDMFAFLTSLFVFTGVNGAFKSARPKVRKKEDS